VGRFFQEIRAVLENAPVVNRLQAMSPRRVLICAGFLLQPLMALDTGGGSPLAKQLNDSFSSVFEKVAPSVVVIESKAFTPRAIPGLPKGLEFFLRRPDGSADSDEPNIGSGFIFRPDGYIITNNHVIEDASAITVRLRDGRKFEAEVVGMDERTDLAVLKVAATGLPSAEIADSDGVKVGQFAFAIGTPMDLPFTFTVGVVSAKDRSLGGAYGELIQTDASINPGNSGGPLCDIDGRVVGVNTLISGMSRGLGFAIPMNVVKNIATQLIDDGHVRRPWLGISIAGIEESVRFQKVFPALARGVVVQGIEPGAPAQSSDLRPGDVILKVDGTEVGLAVELQKQILGKQIGQKVELDVWRQGRTVRIAVQTGEQPDFQRAAMRPRRVAPRTDVGTPPARQPSTPGMTYEDATPENLDALGIKRTERSGAVVTAVEEGSIAAVAGVKAGDVITEAGGVRILKALDLDKVIAGVGEGDGTLLLIERSGERTFAILKP
jgi:S1-C subfamily serine protease